MKKLKIIQIRIRIQTFIVKSGEVSKPYTDDGKALRYITMKHFFSDRCLPIMPIFAAWMDVKMKNYSNCGFGFIIFSISFIDDQSTVLDNEMCTKLFQFFAQNCVSWYACVNSFSLVKTTLTSGVWNHNTRDKKNYFTFPSIITISTEPNNNETTVFLLHLLHFPPLICGVRKGRTESGSFWKAFYSIPRRPDP